jgi:hypothetical protein
MNSATSRVAASRVGHGIRAPSSVFSVAKKLSATALSQQLPVRLMLLTAPCGLMRKRVTTSEGGAGDHKHTTRMTTTITNMQKAPISASVFEAPAGYAKVAMTDAIGASAQAQAAAAQAHKPDRANSEWSGQPECQRFSRVHVELLKNALRVVSHRVWTHPQLERELGIAIAIR